MCVFPAFRVNFEAIFIKFVDQCCVPSGARPGGEVLSRSIFDFPRGCGGVGRRDDQHLDKKSTGPV